MKITFAPCLIENTGCNYYEEHYHYEKISEIIDFVCECIRNPEIDYFQNRSQGNVFFSFPQYSADTVLNNKIRTDLLPKIQKQLSNLVEVNNNNYAIAFEKYFKYLTTTSESIVIFVSEEQGMLEGKGYTFKSCRNNDCIVLFNPYICEYSIIEGIINDDLTENVALCKEICKHTNKYFLPYSKLKDAERNKFDFQYGKIVALRNKYVYNHRLSSINTRHAGGRRRDVYVKYDARKKPMYYISVDTEHGAIELFKHRKTNKPEHMGEYNFSCDQTKKAEPKTHVLYLDY